MSKKTITFYDRFSAFYPLVDIFLQPQKRRLFEEINELPSGQLLEIGVGNGKHLPLYKSHNIVAIDTSIQMLNIARNQQAQNVLLQQMDAQELMFADETFDYLVLSHVIAVVDDPEKLLSESYRVLKPGGKIFILNHFTPDNCLKFVDKSFAVFAKLLQFKSVFHISNLHELQKFRLEKEIRFRPLSYFRLLIFSKA